MPGTADGGPTSGHRSRPCLSRGSLLRGLHSGTAVPESQQGSRPLPRRRCRPDSRRPVHPALQGITQGCTPAAGTGSAPFRPGRVVRSKGANLHTCWRSCRYTPRLCRCRHASGCTLLSLKPACRNWSASCVEDSSDCHIRLFTIWHVELTGIPPDSSSSPCRSLMALSPGALRNWCAAGTPPASTAPNNHLGTKPGFRLAGRRGVVKKLNARPSKGVGRLLSDCIGAARPSAIGASEC